MVCREGRVGAEAQEGVPPYQEGSRLGGGPLATIPLPICELPPTVDTHLQHATARASLPLRLPRPAEIRVSLSATLPFTAS